MVSTDDNFRFIRPTVLTGSLEESQREYARHLEEANRQRFEGKEDIERALSAINWRLAALNEDLVTGTGTEDSMLSSVNSIGKHVDEIQEQAQSLTAPLVLPRLEDISVDLVPAHLLERLDEYRRDQSWVNLFLGVSLGGVTSVGVTAISLSTLSIELIGLLILLFFVSGALGFAAYRIGVRSDSLRKRLFTRSSDDEKV